VSAGGGARAALLLDRDGVVIEDRHRLGDPAGVALLPGAAATVAAANAAGVPVAIVTNQSGIGRGLYDEAAYRAVNQRLADLLAAQGARIDGFFHCPHRPDEGCACRKPKPGLLHSAAAALGLDLGRSVLIGDKLSDLEAARRAGSRAVLARTGYGAGVERELGASGRTDLYDACVDSLADALPLLRAWLWS
jgi:D-glycero-D-manno-heptose 1,7-bisphosphate phosphatase